MRFFHRLVDFAFVAALLACAAVIFVYLHRGGRGDRVCYALGSGGPGTLSVWPPGARCWAGDEGSELQVFVSHYFFFALIGAWAPIAGLYLMVLRRRQTATVLEPW